MFLYSYFIIRLILKIPESNLQSEWGPTEGLYAMVIEKIVLNLSSHPSSFAGGLAILIRRIMLAVLRLVYLSLGFARRVGQNMPFLLAP